MTQIERADNFIASLGVEAYAVGGRVRDELLGIRPKDADYMVRGVSLMRLGQLLLNAGGRGRNAAIVDRRGQQLGWRVSIPGIGLIEVVLPRAERSVGPGREMEIIVDPNLSLEEDAKRRDFTFNALYKLISGGPDVPRTLLVFGTSPVEGIFDPTGRGLYDLERRIINTTHPDSFRDDPLRTLRALRFMARGFTISGETMVQMTKHAAAVSGLTAAGHTSGTVYDEFSKILMSDNAAEALRMAAGTGVLESAMPELKAMIGFDQGSRYHDLTTDEHTFEALRMACRVGASLRVRWALLFHDAGKPATAWRGDDGRLHYYARPVIFESKGADAPEINEDHQVVSETLWRAAAERMNVPKALREDVATLIRNHMVPMRPKAKGSSVRRMRVKYGDDLLRDLLMHRACDISGKGRGTVNKNHLHYIESLEKWRRMAVDAGVPASVKDLAISGRNLQALGCEGKQIGDALKAVLDEVVVDPSPLKLTHEWQIQRAAALA